MISDLIEMAKQRLVTCALAAHRCPNGFFAIAAPTIRQAKASHWEDLKSLTPVSAVVRIAERDLTIELKNGAIIAVAGMRNPGKIEGAFLDGIILDGYDKMRPDIWSGYVLPALSCPGRYGWAWILGVPEGSDYYYEIHFRRARWRHYIHKVSVK